MAVIALTKYREIVLLQREMNESDHNSFALLKMSAHPYHRSNHLRMARGWSGGAMVLGKLPVPGRPTIWITVGQGPTALAVGAGCLDIFTLLYLFSLGDGPI